jgi:hypothetical protein
VKKKDSLIRGKFRLGENQFPSLHEKAEKIMREIERIQQQASIRTKSAKAKPNRPRGGPHP